MNVRVSPVLNRVLCGGAHDIEKARVESDKDGVSSPPRRDAAPLLHRDVRGRRPHALRLHATHRLAERTTVSHVTAAAGRSQGLGEAPHHALPDVLAVGGTATDTEIVLYASVLLGGGSQREF